MISCATASSSSSRFVSISAAFSRLCTLDLWDSMSCSGRRGAMFHVPTEVNVNCLQESVSINLETVSPPLADSFAQDTRPSQCRPFEFADLAHEVGADLETPPVG